MPEEGIETQDLKDQLDEAKEHAEHAEGAGRWLLWLSLSTAILAVMAAVASLQSGDHANEAIVVKTDATLAQSHADDAWSYYQARSIKQDMFGAFAQMAPRPELAAEWSKRAEAEGAEKAKLKEEADKIVEEVKEADEESRHHLAVHHRFAKSVTVFQVAIALAAIAALTRRKLMWWISLGLGVVGGVFFVLGFVT